MPDVRHPESLEPRFPVMEMSTMGNWRMSDANTTTTMSEAHEMESRVSNQE